MSSRIDRSPPGGPRPVRPLARHGFTLLEMLVVLAIVATLAALVGPEILRNTSDAKSHAARSQIELLSLAIDGYRLDVGRYPTTAEGLASLRALPQGAEDVAGQWRGPYLRRVIPNDPWGRPYIYESPGRHNPGSYDLFSLGRDGTAGGRAEDADATSWGGSVTGR